MNLSPDISDYFNETDIALEDGKEYIIYIAPTFASSYPIVQLYSKYNPIFICDGAEDIIDVPKHNYITLTKKGREYIDNGGGNFSELVANSPFVAKLISNLKTHQKTVWIKTFKNSLEFKSLFDANVKSLGLTIEQFHKWNDKIEQYRQFQDIIPIADFVITSKEEAIDNFDALASCKGVVTSLPQGEQGDGVRLHANKSSLQEYLSQITEDEFILMKALSVKSTPSVDILIASKDDVIVYGLSEQILDGFACLGAKYPANLSQEVMDLCYEVSNKIATKLAEDGVKGIVNIDLIIDENDKVYFCELNPRYAGATHNRMLALEDSLASSNISIVDLEILAIKEGTFKGYHLHLGRENVFWYKKEIYPEFSGEVRNLSASNDALKLARSGKGAVMVGQRRVGALATKNKTSLGNLICMGRTKEELDESIRIGEELVARYVPLEIKLVDVA